MQTPEHTPILTPYGTLGTNLNITKVAITTIHDTITVMENFVVSNPVRVDIIL